MNLLTKWPLIKLTEEQVSVAIDMYKEGSSIKEVAIRMSVTPQSMWMLLKKRIPLRPQVVYGEASRMFRGGRISDDSVINQLEYAVKTGKITKPTACEQCSKMTRLINGHHDDYNKPLEVRWLCHKCHFEWHVLHKAIPKASTHIEKRATLCLYCGAEFYSSRARKKVCTRSCGSRLAWQRRKDNDPPR